MLQERQQETIIAHTGFLVLNSTMTHMSFYKEKVPLCMSCQDDCFHQQLTVLLLLWLQMFARAQHEAICATSLTGLYWPTTSTRENSFHISYVTISSLKPLVMKIVCGIQTSTFMS